MLVNLYLNLLLLLSITTGSVLALEQSANRSSSTINSSSVISTTTSDLQTYLCASSFRELQATHKTAQSCKSVPCPSGLFCFEYTVAITDDNNTTVDVGHEIILQPTTTSTTNYARELASNLHITVEMQDNYNHGVNCTLAMADWSLCYTKNVLLDYWGDEDYSDPNFQIYFSSIHRVLQVHSPDFEHQHVTGDLTYIQPSPSRDYNQI